MPSIVFFSEHVQSFLKKNPKLSQNELDFLNNILNEVQFFKQVIKNLYDVSQYRGLSQAEYLEKYKINEENIKSVTLKFMQRLHKQLKAERDQSIKDSEYNILLRWLIYYEKATRHKVSEDKIPIPKPSKTHSNLLNFCSLIGGTYYKMRQLEDPFLKFHKYEKNSWSFSQGECAGYAQAWIHGVVREGTANIPIFNKEINDIQANAENFILRREVYWLKECFRAGEVHRTYSFSSSRCIENLLNEMTPNRVYEVSTDSHAMGIRMLNDSKENIVGYEFFDSNGGIFNFTNRNLFIAFLSGWMLNYISLDQNSITLTVGLNIAKPHKSSVDLVVGNPPSDAEIVLAIKNLSQEFNEVYAAGRNQKSLKGIFIQSVRSLVAEISSVDQLKEVRKILNDPTLFIHHFRDRCEFIKDAFWRKTVTPSWHKIDVILVNREMQLEAFQKCFL